MDFYHFWFYEYVLNTQWFLYGIVGLVLLVNLTSPIWIWYLLAGRFSFNKITKKQK